MPAVQPFAVPVGVWDIGAAVVIEYLIAGYTLEENRKVNVLPVYVQLETVNPVGVWITDHGKVFVVQQVIVA